MAGPGTDPDTHFRHVLGRYPTGVCVVTAVARDGSPVGMTVGSFTSVSLQPPLVAFLTGTGSGVAATITDVGRFAVNVLADDQVALCHRFAARRHDRFGDLPWRPSPMGSPVLDDAPAWIDCTLHTVHELGDHRLLVGAVHALDVQRPATPLLFFGGGYGQVSALSLT